ncbi:MAG TPA: prenyltransferase [Polyangiaceae bacterium]
MTTNTVARAWAVVRLGRPIFLLGGVALYGLGALASARRGYGFDLGAFALGQLAVSSIQLMTHYANDYFDYEADKANHTPTRWSGGSRVLVNGELPRAVALRAALAAGAVAPLAGLALLLRQPSQFAAVLLLCAMQFLAWSYSGPPLRLHSRGLGEPTTALVVPLLTPLAGFVLQAGRFELHPLVLAAPLALLQIAMLVTIEFPDRAGDRSVGKSSWVVLLGPGRAARLIQATIAGAFLLAFSSINLGVPVRAVLPWCALLPLAHRLWFRLECGDYEQVSAWEGLSFSAVALFFLAIVAQWVALL